MIALSLRILARRLLVPALLLGLVTAPAHALRVVTWNILHLPSSSQSSMRLVLAAIDPDVIVCQEVDNTTDVSAFLNNVLNGAGGPGGFAVATFTNGFDSDNALFYRPAKVTFAGASAHADIATSLRQIDRWTLGLNGYASAESQFTVYTMHLKAGSSSSDQNQRLGETMLLRANANQLPGGTHFLYTGDFNIRSSSEAAYQQMVGSQADNDGRAFDPINAPGNWNNNSFFAQIHTQSPHSNNASAPPGAATGGVDDRFDQILVSASLDDLEGFAVLPGTYHTYGNDGLHFNADINDPPTIPEGAAIANALHTASDHLPVVVDFQVPSRAGATASLDFGTVLVGAAAQEVLVVSNVGDVALFGFVDDLDYSISAPAGFSAPAGTFIALAGFGGNGHAVDMDTSTPAVRSANLQVLSDDPESPSTAVALSGTVLGHAVPSLEGASQTLTVLADFGTAPPGGFSDQSVDVHNQGFSALQGLLDVYGAQFVGADAARFSLVGGFAPFSVGGTPVPLTIAFDDSGPVGTYTADLVLSTRDDQALAGATNLPDLTVQLVATIQGNPDGASANTSGGTPRSVTIQLGGTRGLVVDAGDLTPGERVFALVGHPHGRTRLPGCPETALQGSALRPVAAGVADGTGQVTLRLPAFLTRTPTDLVVQVVEPATCRTSEPLPLP